MSGQKGIQLTCGVSFKLLILWSAFMLVAHAQGTNVEPEGHCHINKYEYVPAAKARLSYMMSVRKDDDSSSTGLHSCALISRESLQNVLAAEWVIDRVNRANNGTGYIPGVKIGFDLYDDCRAPTYASRNALAFIDPWLPSSITTCSPGTEEFLHAGIVGPTRSSTSVRVASLFRDIPMPIVSSSATAAELSDKQLFPTFLRTVPSDEHQMTLIADILRKLSWSFVVVIYVNDEYGSSASRILQEKAKEREICIHRTITLPNDFLSDLTRELDDILVNSAKDFSLGVVFIGGRDKAEQFLWEIDRYSGSSRKYGFHFILTDAINTDTSIFASNTFGQGTLTIAPSFIFLQDVYDDLQDLFLKVKGGQLKHPLIEEYIKSGQSQLFSGNQHHSYLPLTIQAFFALVESLRLEHNLACGDGNAGTLCKTLIQNVESGAMLKRVFNVSVDYAKMPQGVPPAAFRDQNQMLSFDQNGDIKLINNVPSYTVMQFDKKTKQYEAVGSYIDGVTTLNTDMLKMLAPDGTTANTIPSSVCKNSCDKCLTKGTIPLAYLEGDAYILGVVSVHESDNEDPFVCGQFRTLGLDVITAEGFLYTINDLRAKTGINFGAILIDDCYSPLRATSILSDFFSGLIDTDKLLFPFHIPKNKLVGVVACRSSGCTIPTASFFMPLKIPVVSYAASSPDLDDKVNFPYFLRTVPSDEYQAAVMLNIIKKMGWQYVGMLYVKNNYGTKGKEAFKKLALQEGSGVCPAKEVGISETETDNDSHEFFTAYKELYTQGVKVVVFFGIDTRYRAFLQFLEAQGYQGTFIFIGSEDWGDNMDILKSGPKTARGSITLKMEPMDLGLEKGFKDHLRSKYPSSNDSNIWFAEFWQNHFQCNFKGGFINKFSRSCDPSWRLSERDLEIFSQEQRLVHAINALYALGKGIGEAREKLCEVSFPCKFMQTYVNDVMRYIKSQTRQENSLDIRVFDEQGNGDLGFDVFNIQKVEDGSVVYVKVGTFNSNEQVLQKDSIKFYSDKGSEISQLEARCTELQCSHCPKPSISDPDEQSGTGVNYDMEDFRSSDILIVSLIIILILAIAVAVAVLVICCRRKYNTLGKKIERRSSTKDEQIYADPDMRVYQGDYMQTHGMRFVNLSRFDPYRIDEDDQSNGVARQIGNPPPAQRRLSNPTLPNDRVDSASQILQPDALSFRSQPDFRNRTNTNSTGQQPISNFSVPPVQFAGRQVPVSYIGNIAEGTQYHDNAAYQGSFAENLDRLSGRGMPETSLASSASGPQVSGASSIRKHSVTPVTNGAAIAQSGSPVSGGVVYYMQGPDNQLTAFVSSPVGLPANQHPGQILHQNSVRSDTSSNINPDFGPYSLAAAKKKEASRPLQSPNAESDHTSNSNSVDPINVDVQMKGPSYENTQNPSHGKKAPEPPTEPSPFHYASQRQPAQPHETDLQRQHFIQQQQLLLQQQQQILQREFEVQRQQQQMMEMRQQQQEQQMPVELQPVYQSSDVDQPYPSDNEDQMEKRPGSQQLKPGMTSSLNASIPDIVGQLAGQADTGVLESVDLSSSQESLNDFEPQVKAQSNGNAKFNAVSAIGGSTTNV